MLLNICLISWWKYVEYSIFWQHSSRPNRTTLLQKWSTVKRPLVNRIRLNQNPGQPEKSKKWYLANNKSKILGTAGRCATCPLLCSVWRIAMVFLREVKNLTLRHQLASSFRYPGVLLLPIFSCRLPCDYHTASVTSLPKELAFTISTVVFPTNPIY